MSFFFFSQIEKICKVANKPLVVTYTGLIQACLDAGSIENGAYVFNQMENFCSPNLVTCNIMLKGYLDHGMYEEAKQLFQKMLEDGYNISSKSGYELRVTPDIYTFNTLLEACITEKRWDDFESFYKRMLQSGYNFNIKRHLRMILDACKAGKVTFSYQYFYVTSWDMFSTCLEMYRKICAYVLCMHKSVFQNGTLLLWIASTKQIWQPCCSCHNVLPDACYGVHFSSFLPQNVCFTSEPMHAFQGELLDITWVHLTEADRIPPPALIKERFLRKATILLLSPALPERIPMICRHSQRQHG